MSRSARIPRQVALPCVVSAPDLTNTDPAFQVLFSKKSNSTNAPVNLWTEIVIFHETLLTQHFFPDDYMDKKLLERHLASLVNLLNPYPITNPSTLTTSMMSLICLSKVPSPWSLASSHDYP